MITACDHVAILIILLKEAEEHNICSEIRWRLLVVLPVDTILSHIRLKFWRNLAEN